MRTDYKQKLKVSSHFNRLRQIFGTNFANHTNATIRNLRKKIKYNLMEIEKELQIGFRTEMTWIEPMFSCGEKAFTKFVKHLLSQAEAIYLTHAALRISLFLCLFLQVIQWVAQRVNASQASWNQQSFKDHGGWLFDWLDRHDEFRHLFQQ